jgi:hypothetical protein
VRGREDFEESVRAFAMSITRLGGPSGRSCTPAIAGSSFRCRQRQA